MDADYQDHYVENNCYDPVCFRLVLEVTSSNWKSDLRDEVKAYAYAKIPVTSSSTASTSASTC